MIALDAGIPNSPKIISACSFTSGSILAYKFADFAISIPPAFIFVILHDYYTRLSAQMQYIFLKFYKLLTYFRHFGYRLSAHQMCIRDRHGSVIMLKNNRPSYMLISLRDQPDLELTDDEKIDVVARRVLERHRKAFEELAK